MYNTGPHIIFDSNNIDAGSIKKWEILRDNERVSLALKEFIYICYNNRNKEKTVYYSQVGLSQFQPNVKFPYNTLYDKVFKYLIKLEQDIRLANPQPLLDENTYPTLLEIPDYENIFKAINTEETSHCLFAEASYLFSIFFICKELAILSGFVKSSEYINSESLANIINHTADFDKIFTIISNDVYKSYDKSKNSNNDYFNRMSFVLKNGKLLPDFYSRIRDLFMEYTEKDFDEEKSLNIEIELCKLLNPLLYIGGKMDFSGVEDEYKYNGISTDSFVGMCFSLIGNDVIKKMRIKKTDADDILSKNIKKIAKDLCDIYKKLIDDNNKILYLSIFPHQQIQPSFYPMGVGEGKGTLALFNAPNLGIMLLNYKYLQVFDTVKFLCNNIYIQTGNGAGDFCNNVCKSLAKHFVDQSQKTPNVNIYSTSQIHFCCFGNDLINVYAYIKSSRNNSNTTSDSYLDKLIYLKSNKNSNGFIPCEDISDNDIILEQDGKKQLYKLNGKTVAKYDNVFHDFYYIEKHPQSVNLFFSMDESNSTSVDEVFACVIVLDKFSDVVIQSSQMFKDDEFLVSKETSKIIEQKWIKEEQRDKILSILKKEKCTVSVTLNPCFVGKRYFNQVNNGYRVVDVDCNYIPHWDSVQKECNVLSAEDNERKHVYAQIKVTEESGKENISIEIYSFVSPLISNLNLQFKDNLSETVRESFNENYTLILKNYTVHSNKQNKDIPSYNQVLAMLRCLGFLEAICINISQDENFFENKDISGYDSYFLYKKILKDAKCCDKTMEKRNLSVTDCQIKNPIYYHRDSYQESDFPDNTKPFEEIKDFESMKNIFK